jgi:hypothetical protein
MFAGLDVPVDDALRMCCIQRIGNLDAQIEHRFDLQRLASYQVPERLSLQQFHRNEGSPIGLVDFMDRADVRVVQGGGSFSFSPETAKRVGIVGEFVGQKLQCDVATELQVFRLIHDTHATAADFAQYAVMGNCLPYGLGGRGHWLDMLGGDEGKVNESCGVGGVSRRLLA